ncbi:MAG: hypothetical protein M3340_08030 [Actinomycetota bacterium]|nr:hypothetical protein [Actinomycetota bacterium]
MRTLITALTLAFALLGASLAIAGPANTCRPVLNIGMTCVGTGSDEWLTTGNGGDTLDGRGGDDRLNARGGGDVAYGGDGADTIHGGTGDDRLYGQAGRDIVLGDETGSGGADLVVGGSGSDRLFGMAGADLVTGDSGNDVVHGGDGVDRMKGGDGADTLDDAARTRQDPDSFSGGGGNDEIYSRDGRRDTVRCGSGRDVAKADRRDKVASDCERVIRIG